MQLTLQDKNELLRAALECTDTRIRTWLITIVDTHSADDGKVTLPCPSFARPAAGGKPAPDGFPSLEQLRFNGHV